MLFGESNHCFHALPVCVCRQVATEIALESRPLYCGAYRGPCIAAIDRANTHTLVHLNTHARTHAPGTAMQLLDDFIVKSAGNTTQRDGTEREGYRHVASPDEDTDGRRALATEGPGGLTTSKRVNGIRREGVLCKRGDRWLKKWVERRVLLQCGIVSYFKLPGNQGLPRGQMVLRPDSWARLVDHYDREHAFQIGCGLEDDGGTVWTFQVIPLVPPCRLPPSLPPSFRLALRPFPVPISCFRPSLRVCTHVYMCTHLCS